MTQFAIGERPGGYASIWRKNTILSGEDAWNSLGEYYPTARVDSVLPPGMKMAEAGLMSLANADFEKEANPLAFGRLLLRAMPQLGRQAGRAIADRATYAGIRGQNAFNSMMAAGGRRITQAPGQLWRGVTSDTAKNLARRTVTGPLGQGAAATGGIMLTDKLLNGNSSATAAAPPPPEAKPPTKPPADDAAPGIGDALSNTASEVGQFAQDQYAKHQADPRAYWSNVGSGIVNHVRDNAGAYGAGAVGLGGLALLNWLANRDREEEPQFKVASDRAAYARITAAAEAHPFVVGFLEKCAEAELTGVQVEQQLARALDRPVIGQEVAAFLKAAGVWDDMKGNARRANRGIWSSLGGGLGTALSATAHYGSKAYNATANAVRDTANSANAAMGGSPTYWRKPAEIPTQMTGQVLDDSLRMARGGVADVGRSVGLNGGLNATSSQYTGQNPNAASAVTSLVTEMGNRPGVDQATRDNMQRAMTTSEVAGGAATAMRAAPMLPKAVGGAARPVVGAARAIAANPTARTVGLWGAGVPAVGTAVSHATSDAMNPQDGPPLPSPTAASGLASTNMFDEAGKLTTEFNSPESQALGLRGAYEELDQAFSTPGHEIYQDRDAYHSRARRLYEAMTPETAAHYPELRQKFGPHPAEVSEYMTNGMAADMQTVANDAADPAQRQQAAERAGVNAVANGSQKLGTDIPSAVEAGSKPFEEAPEAMQSAFAQNPEVAGQVEQAVQNGQAPDFFSGLKQFWDGLDGTQTVALLGGLTLGAIGLMNGIFGEGGFGSMLIGALGLGIAGVGSGALDGFLGLGDAKPDPAQQQPTAQAPNPATSQPAPAGEQAAAAAPAQPANAAPAGGSPYAGTPLAGPMADGQLTAPEVQQLLANPAAVSHVLDTMPDEEAAKLLGQAAAADPQFKAQLSTMASWPGIAEGVLTTPRGQERSGYPGMGLTSAQAKEMLRHAQTLSG